MAHASQIMTATELSFQLTCTRFLRTILKSFITLTTNSALTTALALTKEAQLTSPSLATPLLLSTICSTPTLTPMHRGKTWAVDTLLCKCTLACFVAHLTLSILTLISIYHFHIPTVFQNVQCQEHLLFHRWRGHFFFHSLGCLHVVRCGLCYRQNSDVTG